MKYNIPPEKTFSKKDFDLGYKKGSRALQTRAFYNHDGN
jgi:hypothetical protein